MLLNCPACQKQLHAPEEAAGKNLRCPMCQAVFLVPAASATTSVVPVSPPAQSPPALSIQADAPRSALPSLQKRQEEDAATDPFQFDDAPLSTQSDPFDFSRSVSGASPYFLGRAANRFIVAAVLIIVAIFFDAIVDMVYTASQVPPEFRDRLFVGMLIHAGILLVIAAPFLVFMCVGASFLRQGRNKGMVIAGSAMSIVLGTLCVIRILLFLVVLFLAGSRVPTSAVVQALLRALVVAGTAHVTLSAGIRTLMLLGRPEVSRAFEESESRYRY